LPDGHRAAGRRHHAAPEWGAATVRPRQRPPVALPHDRRRAEFRRIQQGGVHERFKPSLCPSRAARRRRR